ncbi:hypothetical protein CLOM_g1291 [Closterium sp. NIES-68]|nr:hypothetical protein CLOM_g1291 [Closterium sp. NIES-68]GJP61840.1 hypothetical protein CLOP_g18964 [Closterium sp. NIES-67]
MWRSQISGTPVSVSTNHPSHDPLRDSSHAAGNKRARESATLWEELVALPRSCARDEPASGGLGRRSTWNGYFNDLCLRHRAYSWEAADFAGLREPRAASADNESFSPLKNVPHEKSHRAVPQQSAGFDGLVSALDLHDSPELPFRLGDALDLPYVCSVCQIRFATVHALGGHKSAHSGKRRTQRSSPHKSTRSHPTAHRAARAKPCDRLEGEADLLVNASARLANCTKQASSSEHDSTSQWHDFMSRKGNAPSADSGLTKESNGCVEPEDKRAALLAEIRGLLLLKRQRSSSHGEESQLGGEEREAVVVREGETNSEPWSAAVAEITAVDLTLHL